MADYRVVGNRHEDFQMINEFQYKDEIIETSAEPGNDFVVVTVGDRKFRVVEIIPGRYDVLVNGVKRSVCCVIKNGKAFLDIDSLLLELQIPSEDGANLAGGAGGTGVKDKIFAPMPGKVVKVQVAEGDAVTEKQPMVIVEAMKMENQLVSPANGKVKKINFKAGDQVDTETPIIELEISEEE